MLQAIQKFISGLISAMLIGMVKVYQWLISPMLGANCRFTPTCSAYAIQAINKHGVIKGVKLAALRIGKCHPWGPHGYDPVP